MGSHSQFCLGLSLLCICSQSSGGDWSCCGRVTTAIFIRQGQHALHQCCHSWDTEDWKYCPIKFAPGYCERYSDRNIFYSKGTIGLADGEHCIFMDTGTVKTAWNWLTKTAKSSLVQVTILICFDLGHGRDWQSNISAVWWVRVGDTSLF